MFQDEDDVEFERRVKETTNKEIGQRTTYNENRDKLSNKAGSRDRISSQDCESGFRVRISSQDFESGLISS